MVLYGVCLVRNEVRIWLIEKIERGSTEWVMKPNNIFVIKKCEEIVEIQEAIMGKILYLSP